MGAIAKSVIRLLGKRYDGKCAGGNNRPGSLTPELLQHMERQCALWEGICQRLSNNVALLGTNNMIHYTEKERGELDLMIRNMQEFASRVRGTLGEKVSDMVLGAQQALESYDNFCKGGKGSTEK